MMQSKEAGINLKTGDSIAVKGLTEVDKIKNSIEPGIKPGIKSGIKPREPESIDYAGLIQQAFAAREEAYAPYSNFLVGAALLTAAGPVYSGCNIENAAFTPTNCAERTAFFKGVSEGHRRFKAMAVVGGHRGKSPADFDYVFPCGVCRQIMAEFCGGDFQIIVATSPLDYKVFLFSEIFPQAFGPGDLKGDPA